MAASAHTLHTSTACFCIGVSDCFSGRVFLISLTIHFVSGTGPSGHACPFRIWSARLAQLSASSTGWKGSSSSLLPETADAGESYQKETLFLGDSNTVRLYANGLISLQQFCAKEGIGTHAALNEGIVTFKKDSSRYTIAEAVAKMKPRRVVIMPTRRGFILATASAMV